MKQKASVSHSKGFTLIELIVVMAIVASLMGIGVGVMRGALNVGTVNSGTVLAEDVFTNALRVAKAEGKRVRVYIYNGKNKSIDQKKRFLRQLVVAREDEDGNWLAANSGSYLPEGAYFNASQSSGMHKDTAFTFPGIPNAQDGYYYEFNPAGYVSLNPSNLPANHIAYFVIQSGTLTPNSSVPKAKNKKEVAGFKIRANGKFSRFENPTQLLNALGISQSDFQ